MTTRLLHALIAAAAAFWLGAAGARAETTAPPAPRFEAQALDGQVVDLARLAGKVVVLNFWGTWCEACRKEIPDFIAVQQRFAGTSLIIVGAAMEQGREDAVKAFAKRYAVNYPLIIADRAMSRDYGVIVAPTTVVIDKSGAIQFRRVGAVGQEELSRWIMALL